MMSMHGKVADFQIWDQALPDDQLLKVVVCKPSDIFNIDTMLGDCVSGFPQGQLPQLGKHKLVSQL